MKTVEELHLAFVQSFEDHVMIRAERNDLHKMLLESQLSENQKSVLRSGIFDFLRTQANLIHYDVMLNWLEEVTKLLIRGDHEVETEHSAVYFSPGESCRNAIVALIRSAEKSVRICVFTISDNAITDEILAAQDRGVTVKVITDDEKQYDNGSDIHIMRKKGIVVHCDNSPSHMHHKFAIADAKRILSGSYNWTLSAASANQENVIVTDDQTVIAAYTTEFDRLWQAFSL